MKKIFLKLKDSFIISYRKIGFYSNKKKQITADNKKNNHIKDLSKVTTEELIVKSLNQAKLDSKKYQLALQEKIKKEETVIAPITENSKIDDKGELKESLDPKLQPLSTQTKQILESQQQVNLEKTTSKVHSVETEVNKIISNDNAISKEEVTTESQLTKVKSDTTDNVSKEDIYLNDQTLSKIDHNKKSKKYIKTSKVKKQKYKLTFIKNNNLRNFLVKSCIIFIILLGVFVTYLLWDLPDSKVLKNYNPSLTTRIYSSDGYIVSELAKERRLFVPIDNIPQLLIDAFLSAEDKNFYSHGGIDYLGLLRASWNNVLYLFDKKGNIEGASTITQQVAKNFLLTSDRSIRRKVREAILTKMIERQYSKDKILELYLNEIYLGRGSYGVSMASLNYFDKPVSDLSLEEMALLASLPKAPAKYDARKNYDGAKVRRDWVLDRMVLDEKITEEQAEEAKSKTIEIKSRDNLRTVKTSYATEEVRKDLIKRFDYDTLYEGGVIVKTTLNYKYQDYAYEALRNGISQYEDRFGYKGPAIAGEGFYNKENILQIDSNNKPMWINLVNKDEAIKYKNIVLPWQVVIVLDVEDDNILVGFYDGTIKTLLLKDNLWAKPYNSNEKYLKSFKDILKIGDIIFVEEKNNSLKIKQIPELNGAIIAMDPRTGDILAMQGGYSFLLSEFNRATQAMRQPGSSLKPLIYLSAIESGILTTDKFLDAPYVVSDVNGTGVKKIKNSNNSYNGLITLRYALEQSSNLATIRVANRVGTEIISENLKKLGLYNNNIENVSEILGSKEVTLVNLVKSYAILVNGGKEISPNLINLVQDKKGNLLYKRDLRLCDQCDSLEWEDQVPPELPDLRRQLFDEKDAYIVVNLMQGAVERGTGRRARIPGYNIGGKTGTSNEVKDVWFVGFSSDLVVGVFLGYDLPKTIGSGEASSIVTPIFRDFMEKALRKQESLPFRTPKGIVMDWVDYKTGKKASQESKRVILDVMKEGQVRTNETNTDSVELVDDDGIY